jgi:signal transduction histidine kinase
MARYRYRSTFTAALLALTAALTAALGYEAWSAGRFRAALAAETVRDQSYFAASNMARAARSELEFDLYDDGIEIVESILGRPGSDQPVLERVREAARLRDWGAADQAELFFCIELPGDVSVAGGADAELTAWATGTAAAYARERPDDIEARAFFSSAGEQVLVQQLYRGERGEATVFGMVLAAEALAPALTRAFEEEDLLPPALTDGLGNAELFVARVREPGGRLLYQSSPGMSSDFLVEHGFAENLGGMTLELAVRPEAVDRLVAGGMPASRMPFVLALLLLASGLLGTAVWQLRQEAALAALREDFVSGVSHQLRTPLTQIRMFGEMLLLSRVRNQEERERAAEIIVDEANRLTHQVDNVLMFSQGLREPLPLNPTETDLDVLVEGIAESFEPLAMAQGIAIERNIEPDVVCHVDPEATRQAVLNLLDNAVKYGAAGNYVEVGVLRTAGTATVWIEDGGPGVPLAERDRIFKPYVRLDRDRTSATFGSGIGLAVVRDVIEAQGGSVRVEEGCGLGTGARFVMELPLLRAPEA